MLEPFKYLLFTSDFPQTMPATFTDKTAILAVECSNNWKEHHQYANCNKYNTQMDSEIAQQDK